MANCYRGLCLIFTSTRRRTAFVHSWFFFGSIFGISILCLWWLISFAMSFLNGLVAVIIRVEWKRNDCVKMSLVTSFWFEYELDNRTYVLLGIRRTYCSSLIISSLDILWNVFWDFSTHLNYIMFIFLGFWGFGV